MSNTGLQTLLDAAALSKCSGKRSRNSNTSFSSKSHQEVASIKEDQIDVTLLNNTLNNTEDYSFSDRGSSSPMELPPPSTDPSLQRIKGVNWAEEMEFCNPTKMGISMGT